VSTGGGVGIQLALEHPEVLEKLVLMNTVTGFGLMVPRLAVPLVTLMAGNPWLLQRILRGGFTQTPRDEIIQPLLDDALRVSRSSCAEWFHPDNRMRHVERLPEVEVPTLVMIAGTTSSRLTNNIDWPMRCRTRRRWCSTVPVT
jgi:pimeloyl-ACP methyl ester carboxylesterase